MNKFVVSITINLQDQLTHHLHDFYIGGWFINQSQMELTYTNESLIKLKPSS